MDRQKIESDLKLESAVGEVLCLMFERRKLKYNVKRSLFWDLVKSVFVAWYMPLLWNVMVADMFVFAGKVNFFASFILLSIVIFAGLAHRTIKGYLASLQPIFENVPDTNKENNNNIELV